MELAHLLEPQDGRRRELLGDGAKIVDGGRVGADSGGAVGEAVAAREHGVIVTPHEHAAIVPELLEALHVLVNACDQLCVGGHGRRALRANGA